MAGVSGSNNEKAADPAPVSASPSESVSTTPDAATIVIIEDTPADVLLLREGLSATGLNANYVIITDGEKAFDYIDSLSDQNAPSIILLDLNLPRRNGHEVLAYAQKHPAARHVKTVMISSSDTKRDRDLAQEYGANAYLKKPDSFQGFLEIGKTIKALL